MRQSVFFLVPDLDPYGQTAAARILAEMLSGYGFQAAIGVHGRMDRTAAAELEASGVTVTAVPFRDSLNLGSAKRLRRAVGAFDPAIVHTWGGVAARAARQVVARDRDGGNRPRLVVSAAADPGSGWLGWLAKRQIRRADRVIPTTRADGERYRRLGVPVENLTLISPAASGIDGEPDRASFTRAHDLPAGARFIVAGGESDRGIGPKDAIVAFDMIRFEAKELHLVVCGAGPDEAALSQFGRALAFDDFRLRFAPDGSGRSDAVRLADAVLITNPSGGIDEALDAMAAGKPVIGWQTPDLAEIVDDKVTGVLVPLGDRGALAACTRAVLDNPNYARRLGEAGRMRVADRFGRPRMVDQFARLYRELAGS